MAEEYISKQYVLDEYDRQHQGPPGGARKIIAGAPVADVVNVKEVEEAYQNGLNDAWECAKKIVHLQWDGAWAGVDEVEKWFDTYTASEAIEKILQHEQEQEKIKVGDEVIGIYSSGEQTKPFKITEWNGNYYFGIYSDSGKPCQGGLKLQKTGRHFPEIVEAAELLRKMREKECD